MLGILQRLLDALDVAGAFTHHLLACTQQVAHLLGRLAGHEAGPDQSMGHQVGQPHGVVHIGLASRHVLDMGRVGKNQLELAVGENVPDRLPVNACRFHGDVRRAFSRKPIGQSHQFLCCRLEGLDSGRYLAVHHVTNTGHHRVLMYIQTGAMRMQNFHRSSSCAPGVEPR
jgi:hypothetical protein